jgi:cell division protease FtsH
MSAVLGPVTYEDDSTIDHQLDPWHPTHFSDETAKEIDGAVRKLVEDASERATSLLDEHYSTLIRAAMKLLECETVSGADLAEILAIEEKVASETTHGTSKVTPAHASSC